MFNCTPQLRTALLAVAAIALPALPAAAQYELGDGRALENSPLYGSKGQNEARVVNRAGEYSNALVTGNVSGLGNFHGDVGYGAPGDFGDTLGSNDFYDFSRRSYGLELGGAQTGDPNANNWLRSVGPQQQPSYLMRAGAGATLGEVSGQRQLFDQSSAVGDYDQSSLGRYTADRAVALRQQSDLQYTQQQMGSVTDQQGRLLQVNATPLTGLTIRQSDPALPAYPLAPQSDFPSSAVPGAAIQDLQQEQPMPIALSVQLGQQLLPTQPGQSDQQTALELSNALNRMLGSTSADPGSDVYMDLLRRINESSPAPNPAVNQLVQPPLQTDVPTQPLEQQPAETPELQTPTPPAPPTQQTMQGVVERLDYDLPPIASFAGQSDKLLEKAMTSAEQFMAAGRFFDAETAYNTALHVRPGYPLAIVGKVHAMLGAGLYRSASATLDALLSNHPQLIAARYTQPLLPDDKRIDTVIAQLRHQLESDSEASGAALLLAYLGYQMNQPDWLNQGLTRLDQLMPDNPLLPLLHRIWAQQ